MIKCQNGVSDYKIVNTKKQSYELFFVHSKLETVRKAESDVNVVTVYCDHDGKRGNSSFQVTASMTDEQLTSKISSAVANAKLVFDEPYVLPEGEGINGEVSSNLSKFDEKEVAARVASAVGRANVIEGCDINALEVFVVKTTTHIVNSVGLNRQQTAYTLNVEAIPTANGKGESVELFETYTLKELDESRLEMELTNRLCDVKARLSAKKPEEPLACPVIFNAYELRTLFSELIFNANYAAVYSRANTLSVGDALQSAPLHDKLNITMGADSLFDLNDGGSLKDKQIVKDGQLVGLYGSHRFAQYLGEDATGELGLIQVGLGSVSSKEMLSTPHLELIYLSGLQVDLNNDYIGGEIRLAYYFDGNKKRPVTGIAMSGKLSEVLNTAVLSSEQTTFGCYTGPEKIQLSGIKIY